MNNGWLKRFEKMGKMGKMGLFGTIWDYLALFFPQNAVKWDYFPKEKEIKHQKIYL